jgi:hypothetical protein
MGRPPEVGCQAEPMTVDQTAVNTGLISNNGHMMSDFRLRRLGVLMAPEPGNPLEAEGVLNPAAARLPAPAHLSGNIFRPESEPAQPLQQSAFSEVAEIAARRMFDHIDRKFQQAHFPGVINTSDDCAERFIRALDPAFSAIDYCID